MSDADEETKHHEEVEARHVATYVAQLALNRPCDDRFWLLEQMSYHVGNCYGDGLPHSMFKEGAEDPSVFRPLLEHPAAGPLLAYVVNALLQFKFGDAASNHSTAERRAALSDAFGLTGKQGERWVPFPVRMGLATHFNIGMHTALKGTTSGTDAEKARATKKAKDKCLRDTYLHHYKTEYEPSNDNHRTRMKDLREILRETPGFGYAVG